MIAPDFEWARALSDEEWCNSLGAGVHGDRYLPANPPAAIQERYVGSSGTAAYLDAAAFWSHVRSILASAGCPITPESKLLDFGVGWGRLYKYLFRDVSPKHIVGFDVEPEAISLCQEAMPFGNFQLIEPTPPYPPKYRNFDLIYLYSIFSHLSESRFTTIVEALRDRLADNGCIAFTTLRLSHVDVWAAHINDRFYGPALRKVAFDRSAWRAAGERGESALYVPIGGGTDVLSADYYGETILTKEYLRRKLPKLGCDLLHFSEPDDLPQALAVLRKH